MEEIEMDTACKWASTAIFTMVWFGLASAAGCVQVVEFFGAIIIGFLVARLFYVGICRKSTDRYARGS
jgi:hypothetical protein